MSLVKKILFYGLLLCGTLLILITLGSLFYDTSLWYLQILNFPRLGVLIALAVGLVLCLLVRETWSAASLLFLAGMLASIGIQASILLPYTVLADKAVVSADAESVDKRSVFSIVVANVWMPNRQADALLKIINDKDPTLVLTMEVNDWWVNQLSVLSKRYPYHIAFPTDNTYGMALYSKLPLHDGQIQFLNHDSVPSFRANVRLPNGALFQLLTVHPVAPAQLTLSP